VRTGGTFRAGLQSFPEVRALAEGFGATTGADRSVTLRVVLVLEELFTNTVSHGYPPGGQGPVWVTLASRAGAIEITYEDAAPAFDPLGDAPTPPDPTRAPEEQPPGGLGLALVRGLSASASYARIGDRNRVTLTISTGSAGPTSAAPAP
jgi:serine/threonine-protein kinase RsbW